MAIMKDQDLQPLWKRGFGDEAGRLFQGIHDIQGTNTCLFVELKNIPKDRKITYGKIVCDCKPHKIEKRMHHANSGWRQVGLLRRCGNLHCRHHYNQNFDQQHTVNKRRCNDDDGH
jgi:hypothetical protein